MAPGVHGRPETAQRHPLTSAAPTPRASQITSPDGAAVPNLWSFTDNRIGVRFQYEWHDTDRQWWRSYGNELWEFDALGYMRRREASINDVVIDESDLRVTPGEGELPVW